MNQFQQWTHKLKASAATAASAARSFQGLDAMAAEDDYIHSESLNVKTNNHHQTKETLPPPAAQHKQESLLSVGVGSSPPEETSRLRSTTTSSLFNNSNSHHQVQTAHHQATPTTKSAERQQQRHLLSVVQSTLSTSTSSVRRLEPHPSDEDLELGGGGSASSSSNDNDDDDDYDYGSRRNTSRITVGDSDEEEDVVEDDDNDNDDPILSLLRGDAQSTSVPHRSSKKQLAQKNNNNINSKQRFMQDLESRLAKPNLQSEDVSVVKTSSPSTGPSSTNKDWMLGPLSLLKSKGSSSTKQQQRQANAAPLSRSSSTNKAQKQQQQEHEPLETFEIVTSAGILGQDELAELEQLQQTTLSFTNKPSLLQMLWHLIWEHPRESFIVFTLLLAAFAYFYSRGEVVEDDVTR